MGNPATQRQAARTPDLKWFTDARFGMFVHWGLYAIPGGTWDGMDTPWVSEWVMSKMRIPIREYEKLAARFNPTRFDADEWAGIARDAGMKYMVVTAKHHDGFAIYLHIFRAPRGDLLLYGLRNPVRQVSLLGDDSRAFEFSETHQREHDYHKLAIRVRGAGAMHRPFVLAVETDGRPDVNDKSYAPGTV